MSSPPNAPQGVEIGRQRRRAIVASTVGTSIEYYDFFLYGCMAGVVFPTVFFPASNTYAGILQSFAIAGLFADGDICPEAKEGSAPIGTRPCVSLIQAIFGRRGFAFRHVPDHVSPYFFR